MTDITIQCDRCGRLVKGQIDAYDNQTITAGFYDVSRGYWSQYARWEEENVCDHCMHTCPKYLATYDYLMDWDI